MDAALTTTCHVVEIAGARIDVIWGYADGTVFPAQYDDVPFTSGVDLQAYLSRQVVNDAGEQHAIAFSGPPPWFAADDVLVPDPALIVEPSTLTPADETTTATPDSEPAAATEQGADETGAPADAAGPEAAATAS